jgi:hypothetical protein
MRYQLRFLTVRSSQDLAELTIHKSETVATVMISLKVRHSAVRKVIYWYLQAFSVNFETLLAAQLTVRCTTNYALQPTYVAVSFATIT